MTEKRSMIINISQLMSDEACFNQVRELRWSDGVRCPHCHSDQIIKRGKDDVQVHRQRYQCKSCTRHFDDLTGSVFEGRHQPLKVWLVCLYLMSLNLSNKQIASELDLNKDDTYKMTKALREHLFKKKRS
jgi:transposase-like protein